MSGYLIAFTGLLLALPAWYAFARRRHAQLRSKFENLGLESRLPTLTLPGALVKRMGDVAVHLRYGHASLRSTKAGLGGYLLTSRLPDTSLNVLSKSGAISASFQVGDSDFDALIYVAGSAARIRASLCREVRLTLKRMVIDEGLVVNAGQIVLPLSEKTDPETLAVKLEAVAALARRMSKPLGVGLTHVAVTDEIALARDAFDRLGSPDAQYDAGQQILEHRTDALIWPAAWTVGPPALPKVLKHSAALRPDFRADPLRWLAENAPKEGVSMALAGLGHTETELPALQVLAAAQELVPLDVLLRCDARTMDAGFALLKLGDLHGPAASDLVQSLLRLSPSDVVGAAADLLCEWNERIALPALRKALKRGLPSKVRRQLNAAIATLAAGVEGGSLSISHQGGGQLKLVESCASEDS